MRRSLCSLRCRLVLAGWMWRRSCHLSAIDSRASGLEIYFVTPVHKVLSNIDTDVPSERILNI